VLFWQFRIKLGTLKTKGKSQLLILSFHAFLKSDAVSPEEWALPWKRLSRRRFTSFSLIFGLKPEAIHNLLIGP
jgi:hypothetical protein